MRLIRLALVVALVFVAPQAAADSIVLTFDGIGSGANLKQFYNGGPGLSGVGPDYGVTFLSGNIGGGCMAFPPFIPLTCLPDPPTFIPGLGETTCLAGAPVSGISECSTISVQGGFTSLTFQYMAAFQSIGIGIYSGLDATGDLLFWTLLIPETVYLTSPPSGPGYRDWTIGVGGHSVQFINNTAFAGTGQIDNIAFETVEAPVPEPASLLLLGTGTLGLIAWYRRRR